MLPRRPPPGGPWWQWYPTPAAVQERCDRLGNLVLVSLELNQKLDGRPYDDKRGLIAGSGHALAEAAVRDHATWKPADIDERGERLIASLLNSWQLSA